MPCAKDNHEPELSEHFLEMAFRTSLRKRREQADGYGLKARDCGDSLEVFLDVHGDVITHLHYYSNGCYSTNACGNALAEVVVGKTVEAAWDITPQDLADFLETLPNHEMHCAEMAVSALNLALADYTSLKNKPWERQYRKL